MKFTSAILYVAVCAIFFASAFAQIEPSMPPMNTPDPMPSSTSTASPMPMSTRPSIPKLYLSTAGQAPFTEIMITPFRTLNICPNNYPTGFSLRCEVTGASTVFWRVRGVLFKKEYYAPYYLAGNWRDQVGPFRAFNNRARGTRLRVACRVLTRKPVWVDLVKSC